jgi:EXLDI family protein
MKSYSFTRTGASPLVFHGELLAEADSRQTAGRENNRWHRLAVYRTAAGTYVVSAAYHTQWQGEQERHWAAPASDGRSVETILLEIGAESQSLPIGYPAGDGYADRQARMAEPRATGLSAME